MVYEELKWSESGFTGSCLSAPGWLNRSAGFKQKEWKTARQEDSDSSACRDVILLLCDTKQVNHSVNTCGGSGWVVIVTKNPWHVIVMFLNESEHIKITIFFFYVLLPFKTQSTASSCVTFHTCVFKTLLSNFLIIEDRRCLQQMLLTCRSHIYILEIQ